MHPQWYHGRDKNPPFFEGWYFKLVDRTERHAYAIIPGVFLSRDPAESHAFIQVLAGHRDQVFFQPYPFEEFWAADSAFDIRVGASRFTAEHIRLDLRAPALNLQGELSFTGRTPWPVTWHAPGTMGWYAWMPFLETYHGVISLDHTIQGSLALNDQSLDFTGGRGYIEKDWGKSFPEGWLWFQSNHFDSRGTSLTASVAIVPWLFRSFPGFTIGLWHAGRLYRFATYTGASITDLVITDERASVIVHDRDHRLELEVWRAGAGMLHAPSPTGMNRRTPETLNAKLEVRLTNAAGETLLRDTGRHSGLETGGNVERLMGLWAKETLEKV